MRTDPSSGRAALSAAALLLLVFIPAAGLAFEPPAAPTADGKLALQAEDRAPGAGVRATARATRRTSMDGDLLEEEVGAWEWAYAVTGQGRGNIYHVTTTANLYEHRLHLYVTAATPAFFVIYRGTAVTGTFTLEHTTGVTLDPGNRFYSSGPCNYTLEAGYYYYIGASWSGTAVYARSNDLPPQEVSFGTAETSVPANLPHYPPIAQSSNSYTGYAICHQILLTGTEPALAAPATPINLLVTPQPASMAVDLAWTNPSSTTGGGALEDLDGVCVYRDGTLLTQLTEVEIGGAMTWTDHSVAREGCYEYRVGAFNGAGCGWPVAQTVWVGSGTGVYNVTGINYDWTEISGVGTNLNLVADDQLTAAIPIGFDFPYFGAVYGTVRVCSNGFLTLGTPSTFPINMRIPDARAPNGLISPYWDDLDPSVYGEVYRYLDAGPRFIVEWHDLPCWGLLGGRHTFQAILYPSGRIEFHYETLEPGVPDAATIGIEDEAGQTGLEVCYCLRGPFHPSAESAIGFLPRLTPETVEPGVAGGGPALSWPTPNPARDGVRCVLTLPSNGRVDLRVSDAAGRLVRRLALAELPPGDHSVFWDGRDAAERPVPEGVYFLRVNGEERGARKVIVVR